MPVRYVDRYLCIISVSHGITWRASIPRRVGFTSGGLGPCLTDPFDWIPDDRLILEHQLKLLKPLLGNVYPKSLPASYPGFESAPLPVASTSEEAVHRDPHGPTRS